LRARTGTFLNIDWITVFLYLMLVLIGWLSIYSAIYDEAHRGIFDLSQRYGKQLLWIAAAFIIAFAILLIDAKLFSAFSYLLYVIGIILLLAVLVIGTKISGSRSWFQIGGFGLQPSEFAKFTCALVLAKFLSGQNVNLRRFNSLFKVGLIISIPAILILLQPETGSALVFSSLIIVLYREGLSSKFLIFGAFAVILFITTLLLHAYIVIAILSGILILFYLRIRKSKRSILAVLLILLVGSTYILSVDYAFDNILEPHQKKRINVLIGKESDPKGAGYNVNQSKIAIGSGGFFGKGFLKGTQTKFNFVPEQSTDFIFCTVGEEWGLFGSAVLVSLFIWLIIRLIILAERQRSAFSRIYGYGVASILFFHFVVNIGMTIGLAPIIGIPLPFLSYGGSSLWAFTILLFIFIRQDASRLENL